MEQVRQDKAHEQVEAEARPRVEARVEWVDHSQQGRAEIASAQLAVRQPPTWPDNPAVK